MQGGSSDLGLACEGTYRDFLNVVEEETEPSES